MRKTVLMLFGMGLLMGMVLSCGGKYSDAVEVNEEFLDVMIHYVDSLDKADSAVKVAAAMNKFADRMEVVGPKMKKISEKYPELKDKKNQPEEFKKLRKKGDEMQTKFSGSFRKTMKYMSDPDVRKAQQRISTAMQTMAK